MDSQPCSLCGHAVPIEGIEDGAKIPCPSCSCVMKVTREGQARVYGDFAEGNTLAGPGGEASGATVSEPSGGASRSTAPEAPPKSPIPGYVVLEELGRGGMAVVFKAQQTSLDRIVALKIMARQLAADPDFVRRFEREAKALAALNHPNITSVYDRGQADDKIFFVMEYVEGHSLRDLLEHAGGRVPQERALGLMRQVGEALSYVHARGTIHRDIKPENVMVTEGDGVKVTDFGLAAMANKGPQGNLTGTGMMMGTLNYMPPEQRVDAASVDHRADIYAFGVMLYELLTGQIPVGQWDPATALIADLDSRLDQVISLCLKTNRNERFQSIDQALEALKEIEQGPGPAPELNIPLLGAAEESGPPTPVRDPSPSAAPRVSDPGAGYRASRPPSQNQDLERLVEAAKKEMLAQRTRGLPTKIHSLPGLDPPKRRLRNFLLALVLLGGGLGLGYWLAEPTVLTAFLLHTPSSREAKAMENEALARQLLRLRKHAALRLKTLAGRDPSGFERVLGFKDPDLVRLAMRALCTSDHPDTPDLLANRLMQIEDPEHFERCARMLHAARTESARVALAKALSQSTLDRREDRIPVLRPLVETPATGPADGPGDEEET